MNHTVNPQCPYPVQYQGTYLSPRAQYFHRRRLNYQAQDIDINTFIEMAKESGLYIPDNLKFDRYGAINISEIEKNVMLIENILECGSITVILEHKNVESNITSILLLNSLYDNTNNTIEHLKNLSSSKTSIVFIDSQHQQRYIRQLQALKFQNKNNFLYRTDFLEAPIDDSFNIFKNALLESSAKVVIFDAEFLGEINNKNINILKIVLRHCKTKNIAVALILSNDKILNYLPTPDRLVNIWKKGNDRFNYIVEPEARLGEDDIKPFSLELKEGQWKSETLPRDTLRKIPERNCKNPKPGISPSFLKEQEHDIDSLQE
jgi:hypothetical protein